MSSGDVSRGKGELTSGRDRNREYQPVNGSSVVLTVSQSYQDGMSQALGSLRSRIGDKEGPRSLPQTPINTYRSESQGMEDDRDNRKRTASGMCHADHDVM